ncbi:MAG TPA: hypothetical protein VIA11_13145 [Acidimicrobiia bacterium]|nr:hypothetical protein [Acidimicrobiia bacterium]
MQLSPTKKVLATAGAAFGIVLGAAGVTAAATGTGSAPRSGSSTTVQEESTSDQGNVDFTPVSEQGKPEVADANEAADAAEANDAAEAEDPGDANDTSGADPADAPDAPESTNAAPGPASGSTANG